MELELLLVCAVTARVGKSYIAVTVRKSLCSFPCVPAVFLLGHGAHRYAVIMTSAHSMRLKCLVLYV